MAKKILIADSDPLFVEEFTKQLRDNITDLEVSTALDGKEVLKKVRREHPHLLIIEDALSSIDGYKLSRLLKFDTRYQSIPLILLTLRPDEENEVLAKEVAADEFILRSLDDKILEKIKAYLKI